MKKKIKRRGYKTNEKRQKDRNEWENEKKNELNEI